MTLVLCLVIPAAAALLIALCHRRPNLREAGMLIASATLFALVASLWTDVIQGARPALVLGEILPGLDIRLEPAGEGARLTLADNGAGFTPDRKTRSGHGLDNMTARARRHGGTITLESNPGRGTTVTIRLPSMRVRGALSAPTAA